MTKRTVDRKPILWIDTETTGLSPTKQDIIELAIISEDVNGNCREYEYKIAMERPESAHPRALEVNGYSPERWANALDPKTFWHKLARSGVFKDCIIAGHNVGFDIRFLQATLARHGYNQRIDYHVLDTMSLAAAHLKPYLTSLKLTHCQVALGIPLEGAHTALADARGAMALAKLLTAANDAQRATWADVIPNRLAAWTEAGQPGIWPNP